MVTGVDLVEWQIRIARGERLTIDPAQALTPSGHAIECRIYAEDPDSGFMPSPGRIQALRAPDGPGIRDDSGVEAGDEVPVYYDALISKLVAWGGNRRQAVSRMRRALAEYDVRGIRTTVPFFRWLLDQPSVPRRGVPHRVSGHALAAAPRQVVFRARIVAAGGRFDCGGDLRVAGIAGDAAAAPAGAPQRGRSRQRSKACAGDDRDRAGWSAGVRSRCGARATGGWLGIDGREVAVSVAEAGGRVVDA